MNNKIIIINGPNLNLLGEREQSQYGSITFEKLKENCINKSKELGLSIEFTQSNVEGELVEEIQNARTSQNGLIINAGGYTHTSVAILDALNAFDGQVIEVHLSNVHKRESFRHHSYVSLRADGVIAGLGVQGYKAALEAVMAASHQ